ncbi:unnamed protein product [Lupinus luteus]|uniref:Uncharacterized protein n=1 Tax=Lupinus luteus TaxID=3873 RepID=A0AAV1YM66_LUPLU
MSQKTEKEETDNRCQNRFSATTTTTSSAAIPPPSTSLTGNITSSRSLKGSYAIHQLELPTSDKTMRSRRSVS